MTRFLPLLLFTVALAVLIYWVVRPKHVFVIRVRNGVARLERGAVDDDYVKDVQDICRLWGFTDGVVKGVRQGERVKIQTAGEIPQSHAQAFQNAWNVR
jgi:hypothetical protein